MHCTVKPISSFKSPSPALLAGTTSYKYNSGGPFTQNLRPRAYQPIDEEQYFVLQLNGPATHASVRQNVWYSVKGLAKRVPVRPSVNAPLARKLAEAMRLKSGSTDA